MKTLAKRAWWTRAFATVLPGFVFCSVLSTANASVQLVSLPDPSYAPPAGGDGNSGVPIISADGRYLLFASTANNLVLTNNNHFVLPQHMNVFLRDRTAGATTLVSANLAGTGGGDGDSYPMGISTNSQFVLFESAAGDLVANDTNGVNDVFVRDLVNGTTTLVSAGTNGMSAKGASRNSVMTPDGRYVAFVGTASNLVAGDTNGISDVFVRDLQAGKTILVSTNAMAANPNLIPAGLSESPEFSADGRYVAFYSRATNLVRGVTNIGEVYVRDLVAGKTFWASTNARALFYSLTGSSNALSCNLSLSANGQFVAYEACSNTSGSISSPGIILRFQLQTGLTDLIGTNASVTPALSPENIHNLAMSSDGRFVTWVANVGSISGTNTAIYLWDAQSGTNTLVSADLNNPANPASGLCNLPVVSADGQWVAFVSNATNLTANLLASGYHAYLVNVPGGITRLLDADTNGFGAGVNPTAVPALSADGSAAAFESANLLNDNRHLAYDVFAYNTASNANELISTRQPVLPSQTPDGISGLTSFSVSSNGQFVAFYSDADDIVPNDTNGTRDVFVRDLVNGTNILVSVNANGVSGNGLSADPAISGDGRYVAFASAANDLAPGVTNKGQNVFVRDLQAGATVLASINTDGVHSGNGDSFSPVISADGRYVLFYSKASNLAAGSFNYSVVGNLFLRDLQTATNYALTSGALGAGVYSAAMTPDGHWVAFVGTAAEPAGTALYVWNSQTAARTYTNSGTYSSFFALPMVAISPDGQKLAFLSGSTLNLSVADLGAHTVTAVNPSGTFLSHAGVQFSSDGRFLGYAAQISPSASQNVYRYDLQAGTNLLVSRNFSGTGAANTNSDSPAISPDGRWVAYRSFATNIVPGDINNFADLFIYDTSNNATILVSVDAAGSSTAADRSLQPVFSADGRTLLFQSWAPDISGSDFNSGSDLFALDLTALPVTSSGGGQTNAASVFYAQLWLPGSPPQTPTLSWPLAPAVAYQVQYKNNLTDPAWQALPGNIIFIGGTGYVTDPAPAPDKRFYRIVLSP
jgi:Tol biopolymer transport system component